MGGRIVASTVGGSTVFGTIAVVGSGIGTGSVIVIGLNIDVSIAGTTVRIAARRWGISALQSGF